MILIVFFSLSQVACISFVPKAFVGRHSVESLLSASADLVSHSLSWPTVEDVTQYQLSSCRRKSQAVEFCMRNDAEGPFPALSPLIALLTHTTMPLCRS